MTISQTSKVISYSAGFFFCPNSTQVHSSKILWKWVSAFWKWVLDFWKWVSGILEMSFDIFYWKFYIWDWIFNFLLKFQDFCKWKFVKTVIMYEFLAFLTQLITFKRWKHVKIAEKIGFPVFGNEFHHLGNEFHHFFGNEFRSNQAKKACFTKNRKPPMSSKKLLRNLKLQFLKKV